MCCSYVPDSRVNFTGTKVFLGEHFGPKGVEHVLLYENTSQSNNRGPQAMFIHVSAGKPLTPENLINTKGAGDILGEMEYAVFPPKFDYESLGSMRIGSASLGSSFVTEVGDYHVIVAERPTDIPKLLHLVPEEKRPPLNIALHEWYEKVRPGASGVLACFNNDTFRKKENHPFMLVYKPKDPDIFEVPGIDEHTGNLPDLNAMVDRDFMIFFGSDRMAKGEGVKWGRDDIKSEVAQYLPQRIIGKQFYNRTKNGDFVANRVPLLNGDPKFLIQ